MFLNLYGSHFNSIKNLNMYPKSYCCSKCAKLWKTAWALNKYGKTCEVTVHVFPGTAYYMSSRTCAIERLRLFQCPGYNQPKCFVSSGYAKEMTPPFLEYLVVISQESSEDIEEMVQCILTLNEVYTILLVNLICVIFVYFRVAKLVAVKRARMKPMTSEEIKHYNFY